MTIEKLKHMVPGFDMVNLDTVETGHVRRTLHMFLRSLAWLPHVHLQEVK